jgi:hypothetical protein
MRVVQRVVEEGFLDTWQGNGLENSRKVAFILILDVLCDTRKMEGRDQATDLTYGGSIPDKGKLICSSSNTLVCL